MLHNYCSPIRCNVCYITIYNSRSDGRHGHRHTKHNVTHQIDDLQKAVQSIQAKVGNQSVGTNSEIATMLDDMLTAREEIRMNEHRIAMVNLI